MKQSSRGLPESWYGECTKELWAVNSGFSFLVLNGFLSHLLLSVELLIHSGLSCGVLLWTKLKTKPVRITCKIRAKPSV